MCPWIFDAVIVMAIWSPFCYTGFGFQCLNMYVQWVLSSIEACLSKWFDLCFQYMIFRNYTRFFYEEWGSMYDLDFMSALALKQILEQAMAHFMVWSLHSWWRKDWKWNWIPCLKVHYFFFFFLCNWWSWLEQLVV
jgi:hypothetical protein